MIAKKTQYDSINTYKNYKLGGRKMFKETLKSNKGITLIALVVTILFSYDERIKYSNSEGFLLQAI